MKEYLLDSNVIIGWLRGQPHHIELLRRLTESNATIGVNAVAIAETYSGLRESDVARAERVIQGFDFWVIEFYVARLAGELRYDYRRRGKTLSTTDTLIAAHAIARGAALITSNLKDFPMPELQLVPVEP